MDIRVMKPEERKYTYSQSQQLSMQTGLIGHLRADMDTDGNGFFSSWDDFRKDLKTQEFKDEFDEVINELRESGNLLSNRSALSKYCYSHSDASFGTDSIGYEREYGVRADTEKYTYMMRLNPHKGEYNLYCYCYRRDWLDSHIKQAEKEIRFIDSHYNNLFWIPDGEKISLFYDSKKTGDYICRYIDETHVEVGMQLYHACQFAELMEKNGGLYMPTNPSLPEKCWAFREMTDEVIQITSGEKGFVALNMGSADVDEKKQRVSDRNRELHVSKAQQAAMVAGSMFGWTAPCANPKNYDNAGNAISQKHKERGDER